jgi:hypothetical protein
LDVSDDVVAARRPSRRAAPWRAVVVEDRVREWRVDDVTPDTREGSG